MRQRTAKYITWFVWNGALLTVPNLLSITNHVQAYSFPWLDAFVTWASLFGPIILFGSGVGAVLMARLELIAERRQAPWLARLPRLITLAFFLIAWLRVLRGILIVNQIAVAWNDPRLELMVSVVIALLCFAFIPDRTVQWVDSTASRLRLFSRAYILGIVGLLAFLALEPLARGSLGPVQVPNADQKRPNVIVIVLDALTSRDMSLYGYTLPTTPRLDEITQTWTIFDNAHTAATSTTAVLPTVLTGRYPYMNNWPRYGDLARSGEGVLNLPRILQASGYETLYAMGGGYAPSVYHLHTSFNEILGGGVWAFDQPQHPVHRFPGRDLLNQTRWNPVLAEKLLPTLAGPFANVHTSYDEPMLDRVTDLFRERAAPGQQPFFLYFHMWRPHQPFLGNEFLGRFLPREAGLTDRLSQHKLGWQHYEPDKQPLVDQLRLRYDENILKADQELGALIDTLKQTQLYDESLIIITSDHGNGFTNGYQGYSSPEMWAAEHQIPLLVKLPGQTTGQRISTAVSLVDIAPTILDVIGATMPRDWADGQSLREAAEHPERVVYVTRLDVNGARLDFDTVAAIQGDLKVVHRHNETVLYNLVDDPDEHTNLMGRMAAPNLDAAIQQFMQRGALIRERGSLTDAPP